MEFDTVPEETNPEELLKAIKSLRADLENEQQRSKELEAGITRMASYLGVLHVLQSA